MSALIAGIFFVNISQHRVAIDKETKTALYPEGCFLFLSAFYKGTTPAVPEEEKKLAIGRPAAG